MLESKFSQPSLDAWTHAQQNSLLAKQRLDAIGNALRSADDCSNRTNRENGRKSRAAEMSDAKET
jgi:hypothetical protein